MEQQALARETQKPQLIHIGERSLSSRGWRHALLAEHLSHHLGNRPSQQWCDIGCLARVFFGYNSPMHRRGVRRRLARAFREMVERGLFLVIEYNRGVGTHGEALACKILNTRDEAERQCAETQLDRLRRRREITEEMFARARMLMARDSQLP